MGWEQIDGLYERVRRSLVADRSLEEQEDILRDIYGDGWMRAGALPRLSSRIREILARWAPSRETNSLTSEEYRRLERALGGNRRTLCVDLDGFLIEGGLPVEGMQDAVREIRQRHNVVIATAAPQDYADGVRMSYFSPAIALAFGDLADPRGKHYAPIAQFFGYAHQERVLVAVGHGLEDRPADLNIPFLCVDVPSEKRAKSFLDSVATLSEPA